MTVGTLVLVAEALVGEPDGPAVVAGVEPFVADGDPRSPVAAGDAWPVGLALLVVVATVVAVLSSSSSSPHAANNGNSSTISTRMTTTLRSSIRIHTPHDCPMTDSLAGAETPEYTQPSTGSDLRIGIAIPRVAIA
jgi:hypothetical protein